MKILISGCLLGLCCRYDGARRPLSKEVLQLLMQHFDLIPVCPEQLGGLPTPRKPSERKNGCVLSQDGKDVTAQYQKGAREVLSLAKQLGCRAALLKEKSPSCGAGQIYDGSFQRKLVYGDGMTAEALKSAGVSVFGESRIDALLQWKEKNKD